MRIRKRFTATTLAFVLAIVSFDRSSSGQAPQRSVREVADEVGNSIVQVIVSISYTVHTPATNARHPAIDELKAATTSGTGFFADNDWHVVTAYHVVNPKKAERDLERGLTEKFASLRDGMKPSIVHGSTKVTRIQVFSFAPNSDGSNGVQIYNVKLGYDSAVLKKDEARDIAILETPDLKFRSQTLNPYESAKPGHLATSQLPDENGNPKINGMTIAKLRPKRPHKTDAVSVSGFPAFQELNGAQIPSLIVDSGTISDDYYKNPLGYDCYLVSVVSNLGDSGAPLFSSLDGAVLGFVTSDLHNMHGKNSGEIVVVPIEAVKKLLQ